LVNQGPSNLPGETGTARPRTRMSSHWPKSTKIVRGRFSGCRADVPEACRARGTSAACMQRVSVSNLPSSSHSRNPYVQPGLCALVVCTNPMHDVTVLISTTQAKHSLRVMKLARKSNCRICANGCCAMQHEALPRFCRDRLGISSGTPRPLTNINGSLRPPLGSYPHPSSRPHQQTARRGFNALFR
jgi:hypothetical protein